jgi:hypothetical protein
MEFQMAVNNVYKCWMALIGILVMTSCEQEYTPIPSQEGPKYVVEGYVESGLAAVPPYLLLTKTLDFYGEIGPDQFNQSYVHDALVKVSDGNKTVVFQEICFDELDDNTKQLIAEQFGFNADSLQINFCIYLDLLNQLQPEEGNTYALEITVEGDTITSSTYIPVHVPLDSMRFLPPPGDPNDTLAQLSCFLSDPPNERNYYRVLGATNGGRLETGLAGVEEDLYFDGKSFEFQLLNPQTSDGDVEPAVFGLYFVGDTITVKWASIDEATFDFWNTIEFARANQGPFSTYTRIESNINGGIGVWGGYSVSYYTKIVAY